MNAIPVLSAAAQAMELLAAAGLPIPTGLVNTAEKALPLITAASQPLTISNAANDLATVAAALAPTGHASADAFVATIVKWATSYNALRHNIESGQLGILASAEYPFLVNGVQRKVYIGAFLDNSKIAQDEGL